MNNNNVRRISENIVIEYIKDSEYIISEPYYISTNNIYEITSFHSFNEFNNNGIGSALTIFDINEKIYKRPTDEWISIKSYPQGVPIRYDRLKIWFRSMDDISGFYINVKCLDNIGNFIDLVNVELDKSSVSNLNKIEINETPLKFLSDVYDKSFTISFPSTSFLSEQVDRNGRSLDFSMNGNLTLGRGVQKNSLIFCQFSDIKSIDVINGETLYKLGDTTEISFNTNSRWDSLSIELEVYNEWINFYPIYSGTRGGFIKFIERSLNDRKRFYIEYKIEIFEKNIKLDEIIIKRFDKLDFPVEFRPVLKWTSTTAIIDIEMRLIEMISGDSIIRKTTTVLEPDKVCNFSRKLLSINKNKILPYRVNKDILDNKILDKANRSSELLLKTNTFKLYSNFYDINNDNDIEVSGIMYKKDVIINLDISDNIIKFGFYKTILRDPLLIFKNGNKDIKVSPYLESSDNIFLDGSVVFHLKEDMVRKILNYDNNIFYIIDDETLIYKGRFNINQNNNDLDFIESSILNEDTSFISEENSVVIDVEEEEEEVSIQESSDSVILDPIEKIVDKIDVDNIENNLLWSAKPVILRKSLYNEDKWKYPLDIRKFAILLKSVGFIKSAPVDISTGNFESFFLKDIDVLLGYLKTFDFNPMNSDIISFLLDNKDDYERYMDVNKSLSEKNVKRGSSKPSKELLDLIESGKIK